MEPKRLLKNILLALIVSILASCIDISQNFGIINTLYTVSSIMFSISMGIIVTFDISKVKNRGYYDTMKIKLNIVRANHFAFFTLATLVIVLAYIFLDSDSTTPKYIFNISRYFRLNSIVFASALLIDSIFYFMINLVSVRKSHDKLMERINKEENKVIIN